MSMPGGWMMSMTWMREPGQTWPGAAASFLLMWVVMMAAMMLPVIAPVLWRLHRDDTSRPRRVTPILEIAAAYLAVWAAVGLLVYPFGVAIAQAAMSSDAVSQAVPFGAAAVTAAAGACQFTGWKRRALASCGIGIAAGPVPMTATGVRTGVALALACMRACANLMLVLLVTGVMDTTAMALVTAAIAAERLAPRGARLEMAVGVAAVAAGMTAVVRAWTG